MKLICGIALLVLATGTYAQSCTNIASNCDSLIAQLGCSQTITIKYCQSTCGLCGGTVPTDPPVGPGTQPPQGSCGQPQVQMVRIISGKNARRGSWPWQILMLNSGRAGCGGTLVSNQWVVTAAHCVDRDRNSPSKFTIRVGEHDRNVQEGSEKEHRVSRIVVHPSYNSRNLNNDIAMFKLSTPVQFNTYVQPACLPSRTLAPGTECYVSGWGKIVHPGNMHSYLQQARMLIIDSQKCNAKNLPAIGIPITSAMICGGVDNTRISSCHGDSGGPFVCKVGNQWELHGDVSHGSSTCDSSKTYTVFARTMYFKSWIVQQMNS